MTRHPRDPAIVRRALALAFASVLVACTAPTIAPDKICAPKQYSYCRCQDRSEGQHLCSDDGTRFGPCEPCEGYDDPPYDQPNDEPTDAGSDAPSSDESCGDGIAQFDEDCDDANENDDDGCDSHCKLSGKTPFATNACPGLDVHLWGGKHAAALASTTMGSGNRHVTTACGTTTGQTAPDRVFHVVAHAGGTLKATVTDATHNVFLWATATCEPDANTAIACSNASSMVDGESIAFPVEAGKGYFVFVDGAGAGSEPTRQGDFRLTMKLE